MTPTDNSEVALRAAELFGLRDTDALCRLMDPDVEWVTLMGSQVEAAIDRGRAGVRQYFVVAAGAWDSLRLGPNELVEAATHEPHLCFRYRNASRRVVRHATDFALAVGARA